MQLLVEIARCLGGTPRSHVGIDRLLPIADAGEDVRRHVQGMGRVGAILA